MSTFAATDPSILTLAKQISDLSSQISSYLKTTSQPTPNFTSSAPNDVPDTADYEALRAPLNDAALDLLRLINGPKSTLRSLFFSHYDLAALQVALDRQFFEHVPLSEEGATAAEIAAKAGVDEDRTARVLRFLATHRIFEEVGGETGRFKHTANSAVFKKDKDWAATADMQMDDMLKACSELSTIIKNSPNESDTKHSAFYQRFGTTMYSYYEENPAKAARFAQAMSAWSQVDRQVSDLVASFPWETLGSGKVVDIGGGSGHISIALAQHYPTLHFTVQDISNHMLTHLNSPSLSHLLSRVTFQQHDFFQPQPVYDASAFLLRQCLHNYADADCIKILRAVVPALEKCKPGTPLLINDVILPEAGTTTLYESNYLRKLDLTMLVCLGAKQRSEREFGELLKKADERFTIKNAHRNPLGVGLLEVHLVQ